MVPAEKEKNFRFQITAVVKPRLFSWKFTFGLLQLASYEPGHYSL